MNVVALSRAWVLDICLISIIGAIRNINGCSSDLLRFGVIVPRFQHNVCSVKLGPLKTFRGNCSPFLVRLDFISLFWDIILCTDMTHKKAL
jgi:hypothetical protein